MVKNIFASLAVRRTTHLLAFPPVNDYVKGCEGQRAIGLSSLHSIVLSLRPERGLTLHSTAYFWPSGSTAVPTPWCFSSNRNCRHISLQNCRFPSFPREVHRSSIIQLSGSDCLQGSLARGTYRWKSLLGSRRHSTRLISRGRAFDSFSSFLRRNSSPISRCHNHGACRPWISLVVLLYRIVTL